MARENTLDAQELFEDLTVEVAEKTCCCAGDCTAGDCRITCALEVVDELLFTPDAISGDDMDLLLDWRSLLRARSDAEAALRLFCELRRRLETKHYLAFYRLRSWLKNQLLVEVRACPAAKPEFHPLRLRFYCLEAVRRDCLCAALEAGSALLVPRVRFAFRAKESLLPTSPSLVTAC